MPVYPASVSSDGAEPRLVVVGLNWLGDAVMSMPALAVLRARQPGARVTMLVKPELAALWAMCPHVNQVEVQDRGLLGTLRTAARVRRGGYGTAWVMPKSFRAALLARLGGIPERVGLPGHGRDWLLTRVVPLPEGDGRHQVCEYLDLVGARPDEAIPPPYLRPPAAALSAVRQARAGLGAPEAGLVGLFPGAARGPSKRWPAERFAEVARRLVAGGHCRVVVLGAPADREACDAVTTAAGTGVTNLAGTTRLDTLAAWLSLCRVVIANDSGGMHLAAGLGVPVVGIFGITDPARTGPVGPGHRLVVAEGAGRSRTVARDSAAASTALLSIEAVRVYSAAQELLAGIGDGRT